MTSRSNVFIKFASILTLTLLVGCSSKPREVKAELDLVSTASDSAIGEAIPEIYWGQLSNPNTTSIEHHTGTIVLGPVYTSALGYECRTLENASTQLSRIACSQTTDRNTVKAWYLTNNIVINSKVLKL